MDSARAATQVCAANVKALGLRGGRVVTAQVTAFLAGVAGAGVDLVLLDPPYDLPETELAAMLEPLARTEDPWLAERAVVVVERSSCSLR